MMIWYKSYTYSVKATALSAFSSILTYFAVIGAIAMICLLFSGTSPLHPALAVVLAIALAGLAAAVYFGFYRRIPARVAKKDMENKLQNNVKFAHRFCKENPEMYEAVRQMNPAFAEHYRKNEAGELVKTS